MRGFKRVLLGIIIVFFIISFSYLNIIAKYEIPDVDPSDKLLDEILTMQSTGGNVIIEEEKLNSFLAKLLEKPIELKGLTLNRVYVELIDNKIKVITAVNYVNREFYLSGIFNIDFDENNLFLSPVSLKIGKLTIPRSIWLILLKENEFINQGKIVIPKIEIPIKIENIKIEKGKMFLTIGKLDLFDVVGDTSNTSNKKTAEDNKKEQKNNKNTVKNSSTNKKTNNNSSEKKLAHDVEQSMNNLISGLNRVYEHLNTSQEKEIVSTIQSTLNNVIKNPDYPYKKYAESVKARYRKLPDESKERIKSALLKNLDFGDVMKLVSVFGM